MVQKGKGKFVQPVVLPPSHPSVSTSKPEVEHWYKVWLLGSDIKAVELAWCRVSTVRARMKFICMHKLWNANCVIFAVLHISLNAPILNWHFKLALHHTKKNRKIHANNLKFGFFFYFE